LWQTGSAFKASGLRAGGVPAKMTFPVMVAARTTPGENNMATNPAASHNVFPVARMLSSFGHVDCPRVVADSTAPARHQQEQSARVFIFEQILHPTP
jgi:hypothetical protein